MSSPVQPQSDPERSADHLLHADWIEQEGYVHWRFTCEHGPDNRRWWTDGVEGSECWFFSWWDAVGSELLDNIDGPITFPIAVKPSDDWAYEDGGTIVRDTEVGA